MSAARNGTDPLPRPKIDIQGDELDEGIRRIHGIIDEPLAEEERELIRKRPDVPDAVEGESFGDYTVRALEAVGKEVLPKLLHLLAALVLRKATGVVEDL